MAALARRAGAPVYGLGGIGPENAAGLLATGLVGLAAVEGLADPSA
jgi:thiamine monophosphate synthase